MANKEETKKKKLLFLLIIITFIIIFVAWRFYLKIFPEKKDRIKGDIFILELINKGAETTENLQETFQKIKNLKFPNPSNEEFVNEIPQEQGKTTAKEALTNEETARLKEKILEYINQEKSQ